MANPPDFDDSLKALETIVETMESGALSLETALKHYEQGVTLARTCQKALKDAAARIDQEEAKRHDAQ